MSSDTIFFAAKDLDLFLPVKKPEFLVNGLSPGIKYTSAIFKADGGEQSNYFEFASQ